MHQILLVMTNLPDAIIAQNIARRLIGQRLAACANILPGVTSVYRWQGKIEDASECALWLKTTCLQYDALLQALVELHPYELPEVIALPVERGLPAYLNWIETETQADEDPEH
jgi:periplasmic divalent cation tolerance protein